MSGCPHVASSLEQTAQTQFSLRVVCMCAAWCGVCREYAPEFELLKAKFPQVCFSWVDVEASEDLVGDVDVETFPTLLIGVDERPLFFGPLLPQIKVLQRLIEALQQEPSAHTQQPEAILALWQRLLDQ